MAEKGGRQSPDYSRLYYRFIQSDQELEVYLSLRRTDRTHTPSPVIVTNQNGGFALSRYIYHVEEGKVRLLLDVESFLDRALFTGPQGEHILLLADTADPATRKVVENATAVLRRAKLPVTVIAKGQFPELVAGDLRRFTAVGLVLKDDAGLDPKLLEAYLKGGGGIVSLFGGRFTRLSPLLSLGKNAEATRAAGYRFRFGFILGEGLSLDDRQLPWLAGSRLPSDGVEIWAQSFDGRVPLLWSRERGNGRVLVWNWDGFKSAASQGLLLESFLFVRPVGAAATAGLGIFFVDDWPLPMYNVVKPPLTIPDTEFYTKIWWREMQALLNEHGIPFTSFLVFNYNDRTEPPFSGGEFYVGDNLSSVSVAKEILASRNELAFHGYNHVSLTTERTPTNLKPWLTVESIEAALLEAKGEWIRLFGEHTLPFSYVPTHNIISSDAMSALHSVFPSIKVVSSLRAGEEGETETGFGQDRKIPELYLLPRTSAGYPFTPEVRMLIASAVTGAGIWSHFVHADDIFDPHRSLGLDWEQMKENLRSILGFVGKHYPWLRYVTVRDAYHMLTEIDNRTVDFRLEEDALVIHSTPGLLVRLRLNDREITRSEGVEVIYTYEKVPAVVVRTISPVARIGLRK
jgi:hypothetical protein